MQTSTSIKELSLSLSDFHKEMGKVSKKATNPFFKSKYASLPDILDAISEPLNNNGLIILQFPEGEFGLTTRILHVSGEWMEATYFMKPIKTSPQDQGSAITYQRRYAIGAVLSLNIDEDDDGNKASKQNGEKMPIKKAIAINEELKDAIKNLQNCKTVEDLKTYKGVLSADIVHNQNFVEAAKVRYSEVNNQPQTA